MKMTPLLESFIFHFGEMGSRWGLNRTVGQIYGLVVLSDEPLSANKISDLLGISRGNVSMGIKELQSWRLLQIRHIPGDRKDYYAATGGILEMARRVMDERVRREVDPTLTLLRNILLEAPANPMELHAQTKMKEIHDLLEIVSQWSYEIQSMSLDSLQTLIKLGAGVGKVLEFADKFRASKGGKEP